VRASNPYDAILGQVPGVDGFTDISEYAGAQTIPGVLIYRFDAALLFFNADYFKQRVRQTVAKSGQPLHLFIFDMEAISVIDITGLEALEEIRSELAGKGIALAVAACQGRAARTSGPRGLLGTNRCGELLSVDRKRGSVCVESVSWHAGVPAEDPGTFHNRSPTCLKIGVASCWWMHRRRKYRTPLLFTLLQLKPARIRIELRNSRCDLLRIGAEILLDHNAALIDHERHHP
jgi:hypothetical protein